MRVKAPAPNESYVEGRERQLEAFVIDALGSLGSTGPETILVIARPAESEATALLAKLSAGLRDRGIGALIVVACPHGVPVPRIDVAPGFSHEVRIVDDNRFLGAHEQFVIGSCAVWYGDSMRRDPGKKDAFASFRRDGDAVAMARRTFLQLWNGPVRRLNDSVAKTPEPPAAAPALGDPNALPEGMIETLSAWTPTLRH